MDLIGIWGRPPSSDNLTDPRGARIMKRYLALTTFAVLFSAVLPTQADSGSVAVAGRAGTLGLGGDVMIKLLPDLNLRLGVGAFDLDYEDEYSDIEYDFDLDLLTFPVTLDWYPFDDALHISAGVVFNETDATLDSQYADSVEIDGVTYTTEEVGVLSGDFSFDNVAPYIGIGWGNAFGKNGQWGILTDFGVAFIGSANVNLSATGTVSANPDFQAALAREEDDIEDDLDGYKIYPVLSICLFFRF